MDVGQIVKSSQEQAVAAWINQLNEIRLNELLVRLSTEDVNLEQALEALNAAKLDISGLIETNRGGAKGLHGFIAEATEVGVENAKKLIEGARPECVWINNNGPADMMRNGIPIQQKFVNFGGHYGLEKIREHLTAYPDFLKNGGRYQIPRDYYEELKKMLAVPADQVGKFNRADYGKWKWVQVFFSENGELRFSDIEPAEMDYYEVQSGRINDALKSRENDLRARNQERRNDAYDAGRPSIRQGAQASLISAVAEGGMNFCLGVMRKLKSGKRLNEFTTEDWKEVGFDTAKGTAAGGFRGEAIYAMTNFTATPAAVANALVTAAFGVASQANQLRRGAISEEDFIVNSEVICLDVSVSAVSALIGQSVIPIPVLGAVIGNTAGMFLYQLSKDNLNRKEQRLISAYNDSISTLNQRLDEHYRKLLEELTREIARFSSILELAFSPDVNIAFAGSIALAENVGVQSKAILTSKKDIDDFFMN